MCEFWYDYVKPKYSENTKICYVDTESFIVHIKADEIYKNIAEDDIYKNIAEDIKTRFDTSDFEIDRPLTKGKK